MGADQKSVRKKKVSVNTSNIGHINLNDSSMRNSERGQNLVQMVSDNTPVHVRPNAWLRPNQEGMNKTQKSYMDSANASPTKKNESTFYKTLQSVKSPHSPPQITENSVVNREYSGFNTPLSPGFAH